MKIEMFFFFKEIYIFCFSKDFQLLFYVHFQILMVCVFPVHGWINKNLMVVASGCFIYTEKYFVLLLGFYWYAFFLMKLNMFSLFVNCHFRFSIWPVQIAMKKELYDFSQKISC